MIKRFMSEKHMPRPAALQALSSEATMVIRSFQRYSTYSMQGCICTSFYFTRPGYRAAAYSVWFVQGPYAEAAST